MSAWTHSLCEDCWNLRHPYVAHHPGTGRGVTRIVGGLQEETCCGCGRKHESGIYVRGDPKNFSCYGIH